MKCIKSCDYFYNDKDELVTCPGIPLSEINNASKVSTRGSKVTDIGDEVFISSVSKKDDTRSKVLLSKKNKSN